MFFAVLLSFFIHTPTRAFHRVFRLRLDRFHFFLDIFVLLGLYDSPCLFAYIFWVFAALVF